MNFIHYTTLLIPLSFLNLRPFFLSFPSLLHEKQQYCYTRTNKKRFLKLSESVASFMSIMKQQCKPNDCRDKQMYMYHPQLSQSLS